MKREKVIKYEEVLRTGCIVCKEGHAHAAQSGILVLRILRIHILVLSGLDIDVHDTYYVEAHFHYVLPMGMLYKFFMMIARCMKRDDVFSEKRCFKLDVLCAREAMLIVRGQVLFI